ncbi:ABC transporter ATP-binding protein [Bacillus sp. DNRA2]|uniref:ABC transporter ATP-binding protein n=1 Tax=Bacillus sp. DNRA2 TaxID=2723053 RepID=UPI002006DCD1|nr:ABC transporter ATP-binding protein [Bacillus sp. DNRA2]
MCKQNLAVQFTNVSFSYETGSKRERTKILTDFNLDIFDKEFVSVIGPSGCGKSTLFRLISGLEESEKGDVLINGQIHKNRLGQVGYMPQQDLLMPWRTIVENAMLPLELKGIKKEVAEKQILPLLDEFGLAKVGDYHPSDLSGGMRQRVSFLRTILTGSNVLLLDEPFSALDAITRLSMQEWLLFQWEKRKKTVLFITHDVDEALFLSDRILVFTNTQGAQLEEISVPLNRPRTLKDLHKPELISLKEYLLDQLRLKVGQ